MHICMVYPYMITKFIQIQISFNNIIIRNTIVNSNKASLIYILFAKKKKKGKIYIL